MKYTTSRNNSSKHMYQLHKQEYREESTMAQTAFQ